MPVAELGHFDWVVVDMEHTPPDETRLAIAETVTGHTFRDRDLLRRALTHPSTKESGRVANDYERLEFLGDAVISLVISDELYARFPDLREGDLTKLKIGAVSGRVLTAAADEGRERPTLMDPVWVARRAVQAIVDPMEHGHLPGDVAALFVVAAVLGVLTPRGVTTRGRRDAA